jgi:hypothetical protein
MLIRIISCNKTEKEFVSTFCKVPTINGLTFINDKSGPLLFPSSEGFLILDNNITIKITNGFVENKKQNNINICSVFCSL